MIWKVVGLAMPGGVGRHVGEHRVGALAAERGHQGVGRIGIVEVLVQDGDAGDRLDAVDVDRHDGALPFGGAHALGGDLRPASGRRAEIDHRRAGLEKSEPVVDLGQLEGRARAVALAFGFGHVGIVELALEPSPRRRLAALARLEAHLEVPPAGARPGPGCSAAAPVRLPRHHGSRP
jgi:hypothetical protein